MNESPKFKVGDIVVINTPTPPYQSVEPTGIVVTAVWPDFKDSSVLYEVLVTIKGRPVKLVYFESELKLEGEE